MVNESRFHCYFGPGEAPRVVRAPGRVNLIGEHTDYNDGFVLPIAIDRQMRACVRPRADRLVRVRSIGADGEGRADLDAPVEPGEPRWANYVLGVIEGLRRAGAPLRGADLLLDSTIPTGGGLSSSAALTVATALAMRLAGGEGRGPWPEGMALARLCQHAEHAFAGTPCGIMDPSIVLLARAGAAMLLDCRTGEPRHVPLADPGVVVLVCDTQVRHELNDGGYAARRAQCESAAAKLGVAALRDAGARQVEACGSLTDVERRRARHVVGEIARTVEAAAALQRGDYAAFGRLMDASHASLRDDYEVSCGELDAIVEAAAGREGVYGARMTGGGFGGCAIILARRDAADAVADAVASHYQAAYGRRCPIFATRPAAGASVVG
ncbi:MAG: galactokinase [Planctomycetes bacterium]|nr:galactokinase [Planctomycetota bacterium]